MPQPHPRKGDVAYLDGKTRIVLTAVLKQPNGDTWLEYATGTGPRKWVLDREYRARTRRVIHEVPDE